MNFWQQLDAFFTKAGVHKISAKNLVQDARAIEEKLSNAEREIAELRSALKMHASDQQPLPSPVAHIPRPAKRWDGFPERFKEEVRLRRAERGRGKRFPRDLQRQAVEYCQHRKREGIYMSEVSRELGLPHPTLRRWLLDAPHPEHMLSQDAPPPPAPSVQPTTTTPSAHTLLDAIGAKQNVSSGNTITIDTETLMNLLQKINR